MSADSETNDSTTPRGRASLVFISHDTRDAELAEAFSKLLSSVSAGVLKSFRSSDKKGNQGIEYGVEWYPEIMKKLEAASDVVCLLTPNSVGRPWILYEAGVAKGKLDTPVHGLALGIPLQNASSGPFAQFQNSDDSEEALTQLVMQLVKRIPDADPERDVVRTQVATFREKISSLLAAEQEQTNTSEADSTSVAKLFEEVKVMFQDLPTRIERRLDPEYAPNNKRRRKISPHMMFEVMHIMGRDMPDGMHLVILTNQLRDDFPWLYEMATEVYRKLGSRDIGAIDALGAFERMIHLTMEHPIFRDIYRSKDKERSFEFEETISLLRETTARLRSRGFGRLDVEKASPDMGDVA